MNSLRVLDKQQLNIALSTIHEDGTGYFSSGQFVDLMTTAHLNVAMGEKLNKLNTYLQFVHQNISNIMTIALRLKWLKDLWTQKRLDDALWMQFTPCNIDLFHVEFRSIFDHLAEIIRTVSYLPRQVPSKGFTKLKNWVAKSDYNAQRLGKDLAEAVLSCEWFDDLKEIRDSIVHKGGFTLVFLERGKILFQVYGEIRKDLIPEIVFSGNVVDFELYTGLYIGYLIAYLEKVSEIIYKRQNLERIHCNAKSYHRGLRVVRGWIKQVLCYDNKNAT